VTRRLAVLLALVALGACGVKAPPRAAGAPEKSPPSDVFKPPADANLPAPPPEEPAR
jgi:hypothetical protein